MNFFNFVPYNFFSPLSSIDREIYSNILFLIYQKSQFRNSYTFTKEELLDLIEEFFLENNNQELQETDEKQTNPRDKATYIFRKLKSCGWIDTEYGENGQILINLEDYAIALINTYINFNTNNNFELSSHVYSIYQSMKNLELDQAYLTLTDIEQRGRNLINRLKSLNSNIKKYIKKVTKLENTTESNQINQILTDLLGEYKENIIDKAYYYMKTNDNPIKYKREFLNLCEIRRTPIERQIITKQIMTKDNITLEEAEEKYDKILDFLENIFDTVIKLMEEIDRKNTKYINVAIGRIKIILNNDSNIEGLLLSILKNHHQLSPTDLNINLTNIKSLNQNSLYTPRKQYQVKNNAFLLEETIPKEVDALFKQQLEKNIKFSKPNIEKYITSKLAKKEKLTVNDFDLTNKDEFITLLLIFIFSDELNNKYKVKWGEEEQLGNILLPKFIIERNDTNDK